MEKFKVYDRDGVCCCRGDVLYDKSGYKYIVRGIEYVESHGLFERFVSIGKAGYYVKLRLCPSNGLNYADTVYVDFELVHEWYSHKRFGKGLKKYLKKERKNKNDRI